MASNVHGKILYVILRRNTTMDTRFAITEYPDAAVLTAELDALIKKPIYSINRTALKKYEEEYFERK